MQPEPEPEPEEDTSNEPRTPAFELLGEYERLSLAHVAGLPEQSDAPGHWRGVGFRLGNRRLAASFDEVVEILSMPQITHVPGAQAWMLGVANVRGTLLPVVDLKQFLEGERTVIHEAQRIMVVRQAGGNVAVLIDELFGQRSFNDSQKADTEADSEAGRYGNFVKQAYRVGNMDWGVFSMATLVRTPEFRQAAV
ncbi:MAG: chemotaxis protein CheW [Lysobacteraceae bacterium]